MNKVNKIILIEKLTIRESDVLKLAINGYFNSEIAKELKITNAAVTQIFNRIIFKLCVSDRKEAIYYGTENPSILRNLDLISLGKKKLALYSKWTRAALNCYRLNCNCGKCDIPLDIKPICQMNLSIKYIEAQIGLPDISLDDERVFGVQEIAGGVQNNA